MCKILPIALSLLVYVGCNQPTKPIIKHTNMAAYELVPSDSTQRQVINRPFVAYEQEQERSWNEYFAMDDDSTLDIVTVWHSPRSLDQIIYLTDMAPAQIDSAQRIHGPTILFFSRQSPGGKTLQRDFEKIKAQYERQEQQEHNR